MMLIDVHGMIYANNLQNATKALSGKNSSRRVAQAAKFSWLSLFFFLTDGGCGCSCARPERDFCARPCHDLGVSRCGDVRFNR